MQLHEPHQGRVRPRLVAPEFITARDSGTRSISAITPTPSEDARGWREQDAASCFVASTVLYGLPNTNTFEVRQMIRSNSTNVRILSRYFHNSMCSMKFQVSPQAQKGSRR